MLTRVLAGLGLLVLLLVVYGVAIEPRLLLDDKSFEAEIPNLPGGWDGQTVALVADFQIGMWLDNEAMVAEAVEDAVEDEAALLLVAGDFLYHPDSAKADRAVALLGPAFEAGVPVVAVLGNHDYSLMKTHSEERPPIAEYLTRRLRESGATVLENEAVGVPAPGGGDTLYVAGIGSVWAEASDPQAALAAVPEGAPRLVLMHNPESYRGIGGGEAPLALAAHTHGGQIRLLPGEQNSWLDIVRQGEVVADGWALDSLGAPSNRLYVNRGIGFSTVPVRINCRPELTLITLRRSNGSTPTRGPSATADS
ncbi:metallophosphoesterase [Rubrivirga marina]|uniref:Calcineurin-like phosphoesterase domain-containing protein n=1 Tax=Rubrivirga marina TaxID=1196024 RepID=A0A271J3U1_9BACT|nr:metallophosphoesterase [Rubrivirga marina]PAP78201.1 hypothetical protein BSZ37_18090 [Rubrivirga marina]